MVFTFSIVRVRTFLVTVFVRSVSCKVVGLWLSAILCGTERCLV